MHKQPCRLQVMPCKVHLLPGLMEQLLVWFASTHGQENNPVLPFLNWSAEWESRLLAAQSLLLLLAVASLCSVQASAAAQKRPPLPELGPSMYKLMRYSGAMQGAQKTGARAAAAPADAATT